MTLEDFIFKLIDKYNDSINCCPCEMGIPCIYKEENRSDGCYCASVDCYNGLKLTFEKKLETEIYNALKLLK